VITLQADPDDLLEMLNSAFALYVAQGKHCQAVRVALRMDDMAKIEQLYTECSDEGVQKQMAYILARYVFLKLCLRWETYALKTSQCCAVTCLMCCKFLCRNRGAAIVV
jgi:RPN1 N-terminal domain